jgi:hypothetical protein
MDQSACTANQLLAILLKGGWRAGDFSRAALERHSFVNSEPVAYIAKPSNGAQHNIKEIERSKFDSNFSDWSLTNAVDHTFARIFLVGEGGSTGLWSCSALMRRRNQNIKENAGYQ